MREMSLVSALAIAVLAIGAAGQSSARDMTDEAVAGETTQNDRGVSKAFHSRFPTDSIEPKGTWVGPRHPNYALDFRGRGRHWHHRRGHGVHGDRYAGHWHHAAHRHNRDG